MKPTPHGRILITPTGHDLVLTRDFQAPIADVWASVTEPERTARWFGPWEGESGPGRTVRVQMTAEDGAPWSDVHIDVCEPPERLGLTMADESGTFHLELRLSERAGTTTLELVQHLEVLDGVGELGPGWEYYLDRLIAAQAGAPLPEWPPYAAQQDHYARLAEQSLSPR